MTCFGPSSPVRPLYRPVLYPLSSTPPPSSPRPRPIRAPPFCQPPAGDRSGRPGVPVTHETRTRNPRVGSGESATGGSPTVPGPGGLGAIDGRPVPLRQSEARNAGTAASPARQPADYQRAAPMAFTQESDSDGAVDALF